MAKIRAFPDPAVATPTEQSGTVLRPNRAANDAKRPRKYLTPSEVEALTKAARKNRQGHRDAAMILLAFRHGLRSSELLGLEWGQIGWREGTLHVRRVKGGIDSIHPIEGDELRALRRLWRQRRSDRWVLTSERGGPLSERAWRAILQRTAERAGFEWPVHPHMLRHATGHALAARGVDTRSLQVFLGHKNIRYTEGYTAVSPARFESFWRD